MTKYEEILISSLSFDYPDFSIGTIEEYSKGFGNYVFLVNGTHIFRIIKPIYVKKLIRTAPAIKKIGPNFPNIPQYQFLSFNRRNSGVYYVGYPKISGSMLTTEKFYRQTRRRQKELLWSAINFLKEFHTVDVSSLSSVPLLLNSKRLLKSKKIFYGLSKNNFSGKERKEIIRLLDCFYHYQKKDDFPVVLLHGDLLGRNILYSQNQVTGIIDLDCLAKGDPDYDLFRLVQSYGQPVVELVFELYPYTQSMNRYDKIKYYLLTECLQFLNPKDDRYQYKSNEVLSAAREAILSVVNDRINIPDFADI